MKTFADLAEAKGAMLKLIETLSANRADLEEVIKAAGDDPVCRQPSLVASTMMRFDASCMR